MSRIFISRTALCVAIAMAALPAAARSIDPSNFDTSVAACENFYQYANGNWLRSNPVPPAYSDWGAFGVLAEENKQRLKAIAEKAAAAGPGANPTEALVGAYYAAAMDEQGIERAGMEPLTDDLRRIDAISSATDLATSLRDWHRQGLPMAFSQYVDQDDKDETRMLVSFSQGGLGLPERDYYLRDDEESRTLREKYLAHIARMLELSGVSAEASHAQADAVLALETLLAKASLSKVELRDPEKSYHLRAIDALAEEVPNLDLAALLRAEGADTQKQVNLAHPGFFKALDAAVASVPLADWKAYLRWHLLRNAAPYLHKAMVDENFAFFGETLKGQKEQKARWIRVLDGLEWSFGQPIGRLYVEQHFPPEAKARALALIENLRAAFRERLAELDWMGEDTKKRALEKLATFRPKIGYPDKWRDYSALTLVRDSYLANVRAVAKFNLQYQLAKLGRPIDRSEWWMSPQTVNAYYNPQWNEVVFPAGILQPPFFDFKADDAVNYGGIGGVIGHEFLHGFDDQGSRYDARGRLHDWWSSEDRERFEARANRLVEQAGRERIIEDKHINGALTLGENIADLGGLSMAYRALKRAQTAPVADIDGFSQDQRFFLAWATIWRRNFTEAELKLRLNTDSHAPSVFRVNGPLSNMGEFAAAFECKAGSPMVAKPEQRVEIW